MKQISLSRISSEEFSVFTRRVINVLDTQLADDSFYQKLQASLKEANRKMVVSLHRNQANLLTRKLKQMDKVRDNAFIGFRNYCKTNSYHSDSVIKIAGKRLVALIEHFGWTLYNEGYTSQSAKLISLFEEIDRKTYTDDLNTIDGMTWYERLKTEQANFEQVMKERDNLNITEEIPSLKACRYEISSLLRPLFSYIELKSKLDKGPYKICEEAIDERIVIIMTQFRSRQTRKGNDGVEVPIENIPETEVQVVEPSPSSDPNEDF